jgi:hypothetical protein
MIAGEVTTLAPLNGVTLLAETGQHGSGSVRLPRSGVDELREGAALLTPEECENQG